jgi:hypothetical protein
MLFEVCHSCLPDYIDEIRNPGKTPDESKPEPAKDPKRDSNSGRDSGTRDEIVSRSLRVRSFQLEPAICRGIRREVVREPATQIRVCDDVRDEEPAFTICLQVPIALLFSSWRT